MKAIILISSIFYIIGLFIGSKMDFIKSSSPVEKTIGYKSAPEKPEKTYFFKSETETKTKQDSLKGKGTSNGKLLENQ